MSQNFHSATEKSSKTSYNVFYRASSKYSYNIIYEIVELILDGPKVYMVQKKLFIVSEISQLNFQLLISSFEYGKSIKLWWAYHLAYLWSYFYLVINIRMS